MIYTEFRKDGWPLCPNCGEDELWSLYVPPLDGEPQALHVPPIKDAEAPVTMLEKYIAEIVGCLSCNWKIGGGMPQLTAGPSAQMNGVH